MTKSETCKEIIFPNASKVKKREMLLLAKADKQENTTLISSPLSFNQIFHTPPF